MVNNRLTDISLERKKELDIYLKIKDEGTLQIKKSLCPWQRQWSRIGQEAVTNGLGLQVRVEGLDSRSH